MTGSRSDDEAHLAALLAVLAVAGAGAEGCANGAANDGTRLQQWRARRLAALAALAGEGGTSSRPYVLPRRAGQHTRL